MRDQQTGFTLVELLVVITIIVILLALLAPALDQAVYQAELAVCGGNHHAVSASTLAYAAQYRRRFPHRITDSQGERPILVQGAYLGRLDDRPVLASYLSLNDHLNDPLTQAVDIAGADVDTGTTAQFGLWFGFRYKPSAAKGREKGMYKLGDRFTWTEAGDGSAPPIVYSFSVLTGDWDGLYRDTGVTISSHPDRDGTMWPRVFENQDQTTGEYVPTPGGTAGIKVTYSYWHGQQRGVLDTNFSFDDGSVARFDAVEWDEAEPDNNSDRLASVPQYRSGYDNRNWIARLPRR